jgi:hypothetical protein
LFVCWFFQHFKWCPPDGFHGKRIKKMDSCSYKGISIYMLKQKKKKNYMLSVCVCVYTRLVVRRPNLTAASLSRLFGGSNFSFWFNFVRIKRITSHYRLSSFVEGLKWIAQGLLLN